MIVIDLETTGLNSRIHQIISIGAIDTKSEETFYGECRIYKKDKVDPEALKVNGFLESQIRDNKLITPKKLYKNFLDWSNGRSNTLLSCNIYFDQVFLRKVHHDSKMDFNSFPFRRNLDLYTMAYCKLGKTLGLKAICKELNIEPEPEIHNALTGATKAYECLKILLNK